LGIKEDLRREIIVIFSNTYMQKKEFLLPKYEEIAYYGLNMFSIQIV
jgi:hypothetical protein